MATILFHITLPTNSESSQHYYCDIINETTCIMQGINDLSYWMFKGYDYDQEEEGDAINEIQFTSCGFFELSTTIFIEAYRADDGYYRIRIVNFSGNHIRSLKKFHFTLDNLLVANITRNEIENLDSDAIFEAHPSLKKIDLSFNQIASIHSEAFYGLRNLDELFLNGNKLKEIKEFMFVSLVSLTCLELSGNEIEQFENDSFRELTMLTTLNLENNNFFEFDFNIFEANRNLRELAIGNNSNDFLSLTGNVELGTSVRLSKIIQPNFTANATSVSVTSSNISILTIENEVENIVATNSSITKLILNFNSSAVTNGDFSRNSLTGHLSFENFHKLEILDLSFNQIQTISLVNSSLITHLYLSHNNLTFIQNMTTLSNIKMLDLSFNCIENFELNSFSSMIDLELLNLRQTCFKSLDYGTFSFQTKLRVLDISFNNLNSLNLNLLSAQVELQNLFIDGNNLTDIQSLDSIEFYFPKLQSIGLTNNKWNCRTLTSLINKLHLMNVQVFVENSIKHTTNVRGIGCTSTPFNATQETLIIPKSPMPINHTMYMNEIEKINGIVKTVNDLKANKNYREIVDYSIRKDIADIQHDKFLMKSKIDDQINQLKTFGKEIVNKFQSLHVINFNNLMNMKKTIAKLNETNNDKYELISESIKNVQDKVKSIQLHDKKTYPENEKEIVRGEFKVNSEYLYNIGTLKTLEIFLIILLFVLFILALYYAVVYC